MSQIAFLAPDPQLLELAQSKLKDDHDDIHFVTGLLSEGVRVVSSLIAEGTEIVISRGGTASAVRRSGLDVIVVEVPVTGFDIIRAVEKARKHGRTVAAVTFPSMVQGIESLRSALGIALRFYPLASEHEAESKIEQAFLDGADVVVGGYVTFITAQRLGHPVELIESGPEGVLQAVAEARRVAQARNIEKAKAGIFRAILDHSYDGIISVDRESRVTSFNPVAERISGLRRSETIGKNIADVWPQLRIPEVIASAQEHLEQILDINKTDVLCNKVPIVVDGQCVGVIVTFQDVAHIQKIEAHIRRRIYATGHVARFSFADIVTRSDEFRRSIEIAKDYAQTDSSILISGETGCGKELFAQSCHNASHYRQGPFVAINCAALPNQILESELFGYVGGAFTGASQKGKPGVFEMAHGGTLFLDEIGEIEYATQGRLLRVLQEKKVMRLGSDKLIPIDVRVIAATNKNLKAMVNQNQFRPDLYYRLNVLQIHLPALRARREDIGLLAETFLRELEEAPERRKKLSSAAVKALQGYDWPGNVREMRNIVERLIVTCRQPTIDAAMVTQVLADEDASASPLGEKLTYDEETEIRKALASARGKHTEAARLLGIGRSTLWRKIRKYGL
jgi:PAS domain S-box-containing protein